MLINKWRYISITVFVFSCLGLGVLIWFSPFEEDVWIPQKALIVNKRVGYFFDNVYWNPKKYADKFSAEVNIKIIHDEKFVGDRTVDVFLHERYVLYSIEKGDMVYKAYVEMPQRLQYLRFVDKGEGGIKSRYISGWLLFCVFVVLVSGFLALANYEKLKIYLSNSNTVDN